MGQLRQLKCFFLNRSKSLMEYSHTWKYNGPRKIQQICNTEGWGGVGVGGIGRGVKNWFNYKWQARMCNGYYSIGRVISDEQQGQQARILKVLTSTLAFSTPRPKHSIIRSQFFLHGLIVLNEFATTVSGSDMEWFGMNYKHSAES